MKSFFHMITYLFNIKNIAARFFICFISLASVLLCSIMIIWKSNISTTAEDLTLSHIRDIVQNANTRFENELYSLAANMRHLSSVAEITDFLTEGTSKSAASEIMQNTYNILNAKINGIAIISDNNMLYTGSTYFSPNSKNQYWYQQILDSSDRIFVFRRTAVKGSLPNESFSLGIKASDLHGESIGVIVFNIRQQFIVDCFGASNMKGTMKSTVINNDNEVMFTNSHDISNEILDELIEKSNTSSASFFTQSVGDRDCIVMSKKFIQCRNLKNITYAPLDTISAGYKHSVNIAIFCIVVSALIFFLLSLMISSNISRQFRGLMLYIERIDINNPLHAPLFAPHTEPDSDINRIYAKLSQMSHKISNQLEEISKLEEKKRVLEIAALRTQVNPHLIYNTLYLIQSRAKAYGIDSISNISKSLIQLLSYSVTNLDRYVTLEQELSNVSDYLDIMQNKFSNHTELRFDIENCIRRCMMPKMIIQPIVENSIKHGFTDNPGQYIQIKAREKNNCISISVIDNGKGIPEDKLKTILDYSYDDPKRLGIKNVDKRIKLTFGDEFGLKILSIPFVYTAVIINIPKVYPPNNDTEANEIL